MRHTADLPPQHQGHDDAHDGGLAVDLSMVMARRRLLTLFGGAGLLALVGCASSTDNSSGATAASGSPGTSAGTATTTGATTTGATTTGATTTGATTTGATTGATTATVTEAISEETAGPYPGDGSNGPNVLVESGIVRSDIRSSFGDSTGVAEGVPLTVTLTVLDSGNGGAALAGAAVYLWHCDREGRYSMYSQGVEDQNYLRGVQEADANGIVTFSTIYPAAYSGRWPHIHFEVYPSLDEATSAGDPMVTSQLAFPEDVCEVVYATAGYEQSVKNLSQSSLETDNVFSDGWDHQLATLAGDVASGYTATLTTPV